MKCDFLFPKIVMTKKLKACFQKPLMHEAFLFICEISLLESKHTAPSSQVDLSCLSQRGSSSVRLVSPGYRFPTCKGHQQQQ